MPGQPSWSPKGQHPGLDGGDSIKPITANYIHPAIIGRFAFLPRTGQCSCSPSPPGYPHSNCVISCAKTESQISRPGVWGTAWARGDRQGHVWYDPSVSVGGGGASSCCIIKKQPEVVPTILSFFSSADERHSLSLSSPFNLCTSASRAAINHWHPRPMKRSATSLPWLEQF